MSIHFEPQKNTIRLIFFVDLRRENESVDL